MNTIINKTITPKESWLGDVDLLTYLPGDHWDDGVHTHIFYDPHMGESGIQKAFYQGVLQLKLLPHISPLTLSLNSPEGVIYQGTLQAVCDEQPLSLVAGVEWQVIVDNAVMGEGKILFNSVPSALHMTYMTDQAGSVRVTCDQLNWQSATPQQCFPVGTVVYPHQNFLELKQAYAFTTVQMLKTVRSYIVHGCALENGGGVLLSRVLGTFRQALSGPAPLQLFQRINHIVLEKDQKQFKVSLTSTTPTITGEIQRFPILVQ